MSKDKYSKAMDQIKTSENFDYETAKRMKGARSMKNNKAFYIKRTAFAFASAALIITAGAYTVNSFGLFQSESGIAKNGGNSITIAKVELPSSSSGEVKARMRPLFVYQGKVYIQYNTVIATTDGYTVSEEDLQNLRGEYLGTTTGGLDEWSKKGEYAADFASNIGESDVYTVKGYDSKYRLMVYTQYEGGFGCEIYDSFGGLTLNSGDDYFDILQLQDNVTSYQWESFDSWNNGVGQRIDASTDDLFNEFMKQLYASTPVEGTTDMLIEDTAPDSQKFLFLKTKDNLVTSLRLLKDGYVYAPEIGFFQVDKAVFDEFYNSLKAVDSTTATE